MCNLTILPHEIRVNIISQLSIRDLFAAQFVSKWWYDNLFQHACSLSLSEHALCQYISPRVLRSILSRCSGKVLRQLSVIGIRWLDADVLEKDMKHLHGNLMSLSLVGQIEINPLVARALLNFTSLEHLCLHRCNVDNATEVEEYLARMTQLKSMALVGLPLSLQRINNMTKLQMLKISCYNVQSIDFSSLRNLTTIEVHEHAFPAEWVHSLPQGITSFSAICQQPALEALASRFGTQLEVLKISGIQMSNMDTLSRFVKLKHLNLSRSFIKSLESIANTSSATTLQYLDIGSCSFLTIEGISHLSRLTNLQTLYMSCLPPEMPEYAVVPVVTALVNLRRLDLYQFSKLSTGAIQLTKLTKLEVLNVQGCKLIPPKILHILHSAAYFPHMRNIFSELGVSVLSCIVSAEADELDERARGMQLIPVQ